MLQNATTYVEICEFLHMQHDFCICAFENAHLINFYIIIIIIKL